MSDKREGYDVDDGEDLKVTIEHDGKSVDTSTSQIAQLARSYGRPTADPLPADLGARDLFPVPRDIDFVRAGVEYLEAPDLEAIVEELIEKWPELKGLRHLRLRLLWKQKGSVDAMARCSKASGFWGHLADVDFVIWAGAREVRGSFLTREQVEALLYHELSHIGFSEQGDVPRVVKHDAEVFYAEFRRYGVWARDMQRFGQLALDGAFGRGEGLEPLRFAFCSDCGGRKLKDEPCTLCPPEPNAAVASGESPSAACVKCGQVVEPEDAAGVVYRMDRLCFECREAEDAGA